DPAGRPILPKAISDQNEPGEGDQRHQPLVGPLPDALDHRGAQRTQRYEDMRPEEDDKSEHKNRQPHGPSLAQITIDGLRAALSCRRSRGHGTSGGKIVGIASEIDPLNTSALATIASSVITGASRFPLRGHRLRGRWSTKENERIQ